MKKDDYLSKLATYLRKLPKAEYQEAMDYFSEYFAEAGPENEEQVIDELGTPKEAAREVINRLLDEKIIAGKQTPKNSVTVVWIAILAVLATPIALPIALTLLCVLITMLAIGVAVLLTILSLGIAFLLSGIYMLVDSWSYLSLSFSATALGLGGGLLSIGFSLLAILAAGAVCKLAGRCIVFFARKIVHQ